MSENPVATTSAPSKKALKKEEKKAKKDELPASAIKVFLSADSQTAMENVKVALIASFLKVESAGVKDSKGWILTVSSMYSGYCLPSCCRS